MTYLTVPIAMLFSAFFWWIFRKNHRVKPTDGTDVIKQPRLLLWLGIVCIVEFLAFQIYFSITDFWADFLLLIQGVALGVICILMYANYKIVVADDGITHFDLFGVRRFYHFSEVVVFPKGASYVVRRKSAHINLCSVWFMQDNCELLYQKSHQLFIK
jgi:hypothetical protein